MARGCLMSRFSSTEVYALNDVINVDVDRLCEAGFQLATFDMDKTLVGQTETELSSERQEMFKKFGEVGIQVAIISNAYGERVDRVKSIAHQISELTTDRCHSYTPAEVMNNKKPHPAMFLKALCIAGITETPSMAIHFGDQVRADVVGAEYAKYRAAVVVAPTGEGDDPFVRMGRIFVEPYLRHVRSLPNTIDDFPSSLPDIAYRRCR